MTKVRPRFKEAPPRHYIREWRKHRDLTLEELGEIVGVTNGALSQLERGKIAYTQPMLEALAVALQCEPRDLIGRPPGTEWGIDHLLKNATETQRQQLHDIAIALLKTAS